MNITEIRIKLVRRKSDKLRAFASITIDNALVVRDIKVIASADAMFVAMPSRKICDHCPRCAAKNSIRSHFCNDCGGPLAEKRALQDERGRPRIYADIAHPIHRDAREQLHRVILEAYDREVQASAQDGYVPQTFDDLDYEEPLRA